MRPANPAVWHIITSEYPPQAGGVSDYTYLVAQGLADAGDEVHVWCPAKEEVQSSATTPAEEPTPDSGGVFVHREFGRFTRADLRRVGTLLDRFEAPRRLLVQWVPHGYGYRSMNLSFCLWLRRRAATYHDCVELMVHEPYLTFGEGSWKQSGVAAVHRLMTMVLLRAARRVWVSIPAWEQHLQPYAPGGGLPFVWLPVPSNIPVVDDPTAVASIRSKFASAGRPLVGHFGTYDRHIAALLSQAVPSILQENSACHFLLLGRGSEQMRDRLTASSPELALRIHAAGPLLAHDLSLHISACDVLLQPYIDGVSSRRGTTMAGLSHGMAIVTTSGRLTEPIWAASGAVALVPVSDFPALASQTVKVLADETSRRRLGAAGKQLYDERFAIEQTINKLRKPCLS
jgi:glycosyltransferase involved in cell wall biosynthesis